MFAEVHDELQAVARELLAGTGPGGTTDWRQLADVGWLGLEVPGVLDGADATFAEVAIILCELGRIAAHSAYLGSAVLGVGALNLVEASPGRDELLSAAGSGGVVLAVGLPADVDDVDPADLPFRLERSSDGLHLHGQVAFVPDAAEADRLLLLATDPEGVPVIVCLELPGAGLRLMPQPVLDATRSLEQISADGTEVPAEWVLRFAGNPRDAIRQLADRAAVAIACDSLGLSEAMLDATVGYACVRQQFGRPIGSFQAVKHQCADMLVQVCVSRELVSAAAQSVAGNDPQATVAASMAKAYASRTAVEVVGKAMQLHGGMGYTWESNIHIYLKRAALNRSLYGAPAAHRRRLAARYS